jgi:protein-S-isoprenylcysteine O-methyltransferase Ste14
MIRAAIFLAASIGILRISWRSLRNPHVHGFYRFFAFEFLTGLILLNMPVWLRDLSSGRQVVSMSMGAVSLMLAIEAFRLLRIVGKPRRAAAQPTNLRFENTTALVTVGAYRFIRHPMYASLLALTACAYLKAPGALASILLALGAAAFLIATALVEERENTARFGATYAEYMKRTWRFAPFVF